MSEHLEAAPLSPDTALAHGPSHSLIEHLQAVAHLAAQAAPPSGSVWAAWAGLWHDLGKFRPGFQRYIRLDPDGHVEGRSLVSADKTHSAAGALQALTACEARYGANGRRAGWLLAHLIAAHHAGLYDHAELVERLRGSRAPESQREWQEAIDACAAAHPSLLNMPADADPLQALLGAPGLREQQPLAQALWLRMLFSSLVDADFLDTERYMDRHRHERRSGFEPLAGYLQKLDEYLGQLSAAVQMAGRAADPVMQARAAVLADCRRAADGPPGVYSLQVPTGGGKTLASLAFAFRHAVKHGLDRVIVAIPYTSIVEQTTDVLAGIFGRHGVVEHHSQADADESAQTARSRLACENWDAPLIVTTNVQLLESLFAARTSRCRKLHRVQSSVIVLDEAQTLPPPFLQPTLDALHLLAQYYGSTLVSCTATQPVLSDIQRFDTRRSLRGLTRGGQVPREIVQDVAPLYAALERVRLVWPADLKANVEINDLASALARHPRSLAIVNTRRDAAELTQALDRLNEDGQRTLHLSAAMCGQHRADVIRQIRVRLTDGLTDGLHAGLHERQSAQAGLRVVSTQLVEAGVDLDFPVVFRALGGLDAIAQAAGRCNREGRLGPQGGHVEVFVRPIPAQLASLRRAADATCAVLAKTRPATLPPALFQAYFRHWYGLFDLDEHRIGELLRSSPDFALNLRTAAQRYALVADQDQVTLVVPYEPVATSATSATSATAAPAPDADAQSAATAQPSARDKALSALRAGKAERWDLRALQRYVVQARKPLVLQAMTQGSVSEPMPGWFVLENPLLYDERMGLKLDGTVLDAASLFQ